MKNKETLEEVAHSMLCDYGIKSIGESINVLQVKKLMIKMAKWQQEQEQNNENSWFNEYQEVENYIIKIIGDKFLEVTPDKYKTASEATIALLESNWQKEKSYSEEDLHNAFYNGWIYRGDNYTFPKAKKEWIENLKRNK